MENEQRINLDASEKSDESVCVRVRTESENNSDTAVELEPNSTAAVHGCSRGRGRGRRGNTNPVTSQKRDGGGRAVSDAWNHFKKVKLGEEVQAICNYCGLVMQGHYSRGTNHLKNHAKRCPRRSFKNVQQMHLSFSSRVDGSTSLSNCSSESKWDMATVKLFVARMIVLHELPLAFVEYVGFYDLLKLLQPSIETISRNTIKAEILRLYDVEKKKTMGILEACESRIAITTNMWTASNKKKKGYMVITAHYIDSSWVLRSRIMRFIYVPAPHSAENNQGKYLVLAKIARDFLAIPVSTVASESAFSTGGRHLSPHRSRLHPSTVEALVCTQNWFWLEQNLKDGIPEEAILSA